MFYILLFLILILEIGQILDILTTYIGLSKSPNIIEKNYFFKTKINKERSIPFSLIFIKCFLPIFMFFLLCSIIQYELNLNFLIYFYIIVNCVTYLFLFNNIIVIIKVN